MAYVYVFWCLSNSGGHRPRSAVSSYVCFIYYSSGSLNVRLSVIFSVSCDVIYLVWGRVSRIRTCSASSSSDCWGIFGRCVLPGDCIDDSFVSRPFCFVVLSLCVILPFGLAFFAVLPFLVCVSLCFYFFLFLGFSSFSVRLLLILAPMVFSFAQWLFPG